MDGTAIFWPMIVQAGLTLAVYVILSMRRVAAVKSGAAKARDFAIPNDPELSATAARNIVNQFELPVLFYVICIAFFVTGGASAGVVALAWVFTLSRAVHAWVHLTSNRVMARRRLFVAGFGVLIALWIWFAVHLAMG
jgi:hypothetical protein